MRVQDQPSVDSSGTSLSKESAMPAEPGRSYSEDIKVRLVHLAHTQRDDVALLLFLRKGWLEQ